MKNEFLYVIDRYFNLGILGMVFSALFVIMAVGIVIYNAIWSNELRLVKGYRQAKVLFNKINHIDEYNKRLFEKKVIKILPNKVRKAWNDMFIYNSPTSRERLKKAIEYEYDRGTFIGIVVMLTTYIVSGIVMVISGVINADFNTFHGFAMGIALVIGAFCVLTVVIQMSYISTKYSEVTVSLFNTLCDRVANTTTILVPVDDTCINCNGKIVLTEEPVIKATPVASSDIGVGDNKGDLQEYTQRIFDGIIADNSEKKQSTSKADELIASIKDFIAENPSNESLEFIKNCLDETLGYSYCDSAERKKLLHAKLLLD